MARMLLLALLACGGCATKTSFRVEQEIQAHKAGKIVFELTSSQ